MIKKIIYMLCTFFIFTLNTYSAVFEGGVSKDLKYNVNTVIEADTNKPVENAKIKIPQLGYETKTNSKGEFILDTNINTQTILSVEKQGYKPFSLTLGETTKSSGMKLTIEKADAANIIIESNMFHLGDNSYSDNSANAGQFKVPSLGPFYSKQFKINSISNSSSPTLVIGSIIGIDTKMAKSIGQNKIATAYSSPPEIYFNGVKIAEIQINGDNQKIVLPKNLVKSNSLNDIVIKTGKNLMQTSYIDYDDIEFMNLSIELD